ncbi:hypothetical protein ABTL91_20320, partial [Acinetobacter baumannii]
IGTLYLYLLSLNLNYVGDILNATHTLSLFLTKKGISFIKSKKAESHFELYIKVQPKWLNIPEAYFQKLISDTQDETGKT